MKGTGAIMAAKYTDKELNNLIYQAIVPQGLRPSEPDAIDAMLDAVGGEIPSEDTVRRMLRKIQGEEPVGVRSVENEPQPFSMEVEEATLTQEELALYRNRNEGVSPEIEDKLKEMEERAKKDDEEENQDSTNA